MGKKEANKPNILIKDLKALNALSGRLYDLLKMHKRAVPLTSIVSYKESSLHFSLMI